MPIDRRRFPASGAALLPAARCPRGPGRAPTCTATITLRIVAQDGNTAGPVAGMRAFAASPGRTA